MYPYCMLDIMILAQEVLYVFFSQGCVTTQNAKVRKKKIIQSDIFGIVPKTNQVIHTFGTFYEQNIMILAQAVLEIFCSHGPFGVQCLSLKRGILQSNFDKVLWKVNQVIYIIYPNCSLISWSKLRRFFRYFVHKVALLHKMPKSEKGDNSVKYIQNFAKC